MSSAGENLQNFGTNYSKRAQISEFWKSCLAAGGMCAKLSPCQVKMLGRLKELSGVAVLVQTKTLEEPNRTRRERAKKK
jgi:hypothetical protein